MFLQLTELREFITKQRAKALNSTRLFDDFLKSSAEELAPALANIHLGTAGFLNYILVSFFLSFFSCTHTK